MSINASKKKRHRQNTIKKILDRDGDNCWLCKQKLNGDYSLDHVVPFSDGGLKVLDNLNLAHTVCNNRRFNPTCLELEEIKLQIKLGEYTYFNDFLTDLI
jgi:5-methylcytosine-specific restriction endonuclease McrA